MSNRTLKAWRAVPHDPLIFRDGKPFAATPGARATSVLFPFPSTLAGAVRTLSGALAHGGIFPAGNKAVIEQVLGYRVVGPFLFDVKRNEVFLPTPRDALLLKLEPYDEKKANRVPLQPTTRFQNVLTNLPKDLLLVAPTTEVKTKRHPNAPAFWRWQKMEAWLYTPQEDTVELADLGVQALLTDVRTHVRIQSDVRTAEEGALFQTAGLTFVRVSRKGAWPVLREAAELGLIVQTDAPLAPGVDTLGGECRVVAWEPAAQDVLPRCPAAVREAIRTTRRGRLILATPAVFEKGFLPTWVCDHPSGVKLRIIGAAVGRPMHVSGWDYAKGAPKPTRRLAPAGSVYFFEIVEGDDATIERFIEEVWLSPVSDEEQDRRDGFGVALLGTWNGREG